VSTSRKLWVWLGAMTISPGRLEPNSPSMDIPRLIARPGGGLGNRMRVITSFQLLARYSERVFELCWTPGNGWSDEDLGLLFENDYPRVSLDEFERCRRDGLDLNNAARKRRARHEDSGRHQVFDLAVLFENAVRSLGHAKHASYSTWEWREGSGMHQVFDLAAFPVVTYSGQQRCDALVDVATRAQLFPNLESDYRAGLKQWSPVPSIRAKVEGLTASFGPHTVGVHIRRGDALEHTRMASEVRRSTDAAFMAHMDAELVAEPRTNFFLATDSAATEERFRERYGEAIIVNRDKRFVPSLRLQPKDNQRDAVIDMFALARTQKILGNNFSSFSQMAAMIGGIRFQRVLEDARDEDMKGR
jgi:hypothetical protein